MPRFEQKILKEEDVIEKPWGHEELIIQTAAYVGKKLYINKGHRLSLQHHAVKEETIIVLSGVLGVDQGTILGDVEVKKYGPNAVIHVPPGAVHRFSAPFDDVVLLEISTPELTDVIRHEDDYKRI